MLVTTHSNNGQRRLQETILVISRSNIPFHSFFFPFIAVGHSKPDVWMKWEVTEARTVIWSATPIWQITAQKFRFLIKTVYDINAS